MQHAPLFDTHCHLDDARFADEVDAVLERARKAGVARITTIGCARDLDGVGSAIAIARAHSGFVSATVGVHPHDADRLDEALFEALRGAALEPEVVAIGETGLDYYYENSDRERQREAFRMQIGLAREVGKPIVVHTRDAPAETLAILREERAHDVGGIIHCFSEDAAFAHGALDLGFCASFSGLATFPRKTEAIREAACRQPLEALLIETDAPYLAPVPHRGKRNEPAFVAHTAAAIAELRGIDVETLRRASTDNACRVFRLPAVL